MLCSRSFMRVIEKRATETGRMSAKTKVTINVNIATRFAYRCRTGLHHSVLHCIVELRSLLDDDSHTQAHRTQLYYIV